MNKFEANLKKHLNANITPEAQNKLNSPLASSLTPEHQALLTQVIDTLTSGQIDLHTYSKLIQDSSYDALPPSEKAEIDLLARNILANIRQIKDLSDHPDFATNSYQMENLLTHLETQLQNPHVSL